MYSFKTPSFILPFSLRWFVIGISMCLHCAWCMYIYTCSSLPVWLSQSMSPKAKRCLIFAMKVRWHVAKFHHGNLVLCPNALGKHRLGPHPFKSQTSKPPYMQSPKSQCQNHVFTSNLRKLRFYQNKWLFLDGWCGVPYTFPTRNQTSELKNQDFFAIHIRLGKMSFS